MKKVLPHIKEFFRRADMLLFSLSLICALFGLVVIWSATQHLDNPARYVIVQSLGMATGMPTIDAVRHYYGNAAATFVGLVTFFACVCFNVGNVAGIGAGMSLIFNIDWKIGAAIVMVFVFLCYFMKGVYGKIEKAVMREVQFHPVREQILHIDFYRVQEGKPVAIAVPVRLSGTAEGVKIGGKLALSARKLTVKALLDKLPDEVVVDVTPLPHNGCRPPKRRRV